MRVEVVAEQQRVVAVGRREQPRAAVVERGSPRRSSPARARSAPRRAARRRARARARRRRRAPVGPERALRRRLVGDRVPEGAHGSKKVPTASTVRSISVVAVGERDEHGLELRRGDVDARWRAGAGRAPRSARCRSAAASSKSRTGPSATNSVSIAPTRCTWPKRLRGPSSSRAPASLELARTPPGRGAGAGRRGRPRSRAGSRRASPPGRRRRPAPGAPSARRGRRTPRAAGRRRRSCRGWSGRAGRRSSSCAPPRATRKPVITSSKTSSAPDASQSARSASRKPGSGGTTPMFPATGSTRTQASPSP